MNIDEKLYNDFFNGDHTALEKLIEMYSESLTLFIYRYVQNIDEASNIMIDVFANLITSRKRFMGKSNFKTYIFKIAKNEALRYLKNQKKHNNISLDDSYDFLTNQKDIAEFDIFKKDQNYELYKYMQNLLPEYKDVLFFIYFEQMSYKEVGIVMRKSEKQITNLAYRAKKALKTELIKNNFNYEI